MLENYLNLVNYEKCTGCGACMNSCPFSAISMQEDEFGFFYPVLDKDKCRNCGKCEKACSIMYSTFHEMPENCYAVMANDDIRMKSSSGGIFTLVAQAILTSGGGVYMRGCI